MLVLDFKGLDLASRKQPLPSSKANLRVPQSKTQELYVQSNLALLF